MELRHLRYFLAVADTLSFTRAAENMHTAQPSLSQQIRALEREIGKPLFERNSRSVRLTAAGQIFAEKARAALAEIEEGIGLARSVRSENDTHVRIGFLIAAEIMLFPDLLENIREQDPDLRFDLTSMTTRQQILALQKREIDIGFVRPPVADSRIALQTILVEPIRVVVGEGHPLARLERIPMERIVAEPIIGLSDEVPGLRHAIDLWRHHHGLELNIVQHADNVMEYMSMVRLGIGIGLLPTFADRIMLSGLVARRFVSNEPTIELAIAYRNDPLCEAAAHFLRGVSNVAESPDAWNPAI